MAMPPVKYPIGIQSFEKLREQSYLYVDKTGFIYNLVTTSNCVFLSRPRRFGKSLMLSTIQAYFEGKRELFKGLAIDNLETEWPKHTVLTLSLATYRHGQENDLENILDNKFRIWEKEYNVEIMGLNLSSRFGNIIRAAYNVSGRPVVILIDEYDNPIIETMQDEAMREKHRSLLKSIYANLKDLDQFIRFTMLTGVSRFSKMTIFSGLNNLEDISFDDAYASICGITEEELVSNFNEGISGLAKKYSVSFEDAVAMLKANYDGYHFTDECIDIYNPFSLLNALKKLKIGSYWFQSGTPQFLVRQIQKSNEFLPEMFGEAVDETILSEVDTFETTPIALLYQTGYLTIKSFDFPKTYHIGIPNLEVREGLFNNLAQYYFNESPTAISTNVRDVRRMLEEKRIDEAMERLQTFMGGIPYEFANKATELHYENNLFIIFVLIGVDTCPEWHTSVGRIDLLLRLRNYIYVIELKRDGTPEEALDQIREKGYGDQFAADPRPVISLGIAFSTRTRNITAWQAAEKF